MSQPLARVLIIDDDIGMTTLGSRALSCSGQFLVKAENDAMRAIEVAREFKPHLILLDRHMPGKSGEEIARALGEDPALKSTPIVFLTGDVQAAEARSEHPVLLKPVRMADLQCACAAWANPADL
jgi:two-component system alkaline phosphatase synthesis response regulator PhoP